MANKKSEPEMSFQYWAKKLGIKAVVAAGVKQATGITANVRLKESAFTTCVNDWLNQPSKGDTHD